MGAAAVRLCGALGCFWGVPPAPVLRVVGIYCLGGTVENTVSALTQPSICAVTDTHNAENC